MSVVIDGSSGITTNSGTVVSTTDATLNGLTVGKGGGSVSTNTAVGASALATNASGNQITAIGSGAGQYLTGADNTAVGSNALQGTSGSATGVENTAVGTASLLALTSGNDNSALGRTALRFNTSGASNTGIGAYALYSNTTASNNTAVGYQAGYTNSTGANNAIFGYQAGYTSNNAGQTIIGMQAGYSVTGGYNTFVGQQAGYVATTGTNQTFVGGGAGSAITTGSKNSIFGAYTGNQDSLDIRTANNYVVLSDGDGNRAAFWQSGGGWVQKNNSTSWSTFSDQRIKENIVSIEQGLDVISALRPVKFDYIQTGKHEVGFIAQEYETVLPEQIDRQYGIDDATKELVNDDHILSIQQNLVPYLVSAIKELKALVDAQATEIAELKAKVR